MDAHASLWISRLANIVKCMEMASVGCIVQGYKHFFFEEATSIC
jgi:hypothetical protein